MNNLTSVLIIYVIVVNFLGVIAIITAQYAGRKVSDITLGVLLVVAVPISLPIVLYSLTFDKLKRRKRKQDLEKETDDFFKDNEIK